MKPPPSAAVFCFPPLLLVTKSLSVKIYFLGICGTAMGNAALLARSSGHDVVGADAGVYPPMSDVLADAGIEVHEGYDAHRLASLAPDLVVVGNALSRGNPEIEWLLSERRVRFTSLPALLHETVLADRTNVVIAGTHGKTTTTALTAFLLRENGRDPGFLIGGVPLDPPTGQHLGTIEDPFVIEGDEYDSAFFDKRSKFIHYAPRWVVLNNLEFDHADIFRDLADVDRTFRHLTRIVPGNGGILLNGDDPHLKTFRDCSWTTVYTVGTQPDHDLVISDFAESPNEASFQLSWHEQFWGEVRWRQPGLFNARNAAMAALAAGLTINPDDPAQLSLQGLVNFRGVRRRQECRLKQPDLVVIEDFGHHPTAVAATLESLRNQYPDHHLCVAFEPRSNTARTKLHQTGFVEAFARADSVYLGAVNRAAQLKPAERFDAPAIIDALNEQSTPGFSAPSNAELCGLMEQQIGEYREPRLVVFFTNGSFDGIIDRFVDHFQS